MRKARQRMEMEQKKKSLQLTEDRDTENSHMVGASPVFVWMCFARSFYVSNFFENRELTKLYTPAIITPIIVGYINSCKQAIINMKLGENKRQDDDDGVLVDLKLQNGRKCMCGFTSLPIPFI